MPTYVVFDRRTGDVVHAHVEPEGTRPSPEDVLRLVDAALDRSVLDVLKVAGTADLAGQTLRVNLKERRIVSAPTEAGANRGGGVATAVESELLLPTVRTEYEVESDSGAYRLR